MRLPSPIAIALSAIVLSAVCSSGASAQPPEPASPSNRVQTTGEANRESLKGAAEAPLRDLNVVRTKVPDILLQAKADPYGRPANTRCPTLADEVRLLNET